MRLLRADEVAQSIFHVDYDALWNGGKCALIFDLDNTLGERWASELHPRVRKLLADLSERGFRIGILTNRRRGGADPVIADLAALYPTIRMAHKPSRRGYAKLLARLEASAAEAVMIGDRTMTDVVGANRCGMRSIRVRGFRTHP